MQLFELPIHFNGTIAVPTGALIFIDPKDDKQSPSKKTYMTKMRLKVFQISTFLAKYFSRKIWTSVIKEKVERMVEGF